MSVFLCPSASGGSDGFVVDRGEGDAWDPSLSPTPYDPRDRFCTRALRHQRGHSSAVGTRDGRTPISSKPEMVTAGGDTYRGANRRPVLPQRPAAAPKHVTDGLTQHRLCRRAQLRLEQQDLGRRRAVLRHVPEVSRFPRPATAAGRSWPRTAGRTLTTVRKSSSTRRTIRSAIPTRCMPSTPTAPTRCLATVRCGSFWKRSIRSPGLHCRRETPARSSPTVELSTSKGCSMTIFARVTSDGALVIPRVRGMLHVAVAARRPVGRRSRSRLAAADALWTSVTGKDGLNCWIRARRESKSCTRPPRLSDDAFEVLDRRDFDRSRRPMVRGPRRAQGVCPRTTACQSAELGQLAAWYRDLIVG